MHCPRWILMVPALLGPLAATGAAGGAEPAAKVVAAAQPLIEEQAMGYLMNMARFVGRAKQFSVDMNVTYEVLQDDGVKLEFGERRHIDVQRPGRLRSVETDGSNGNVSLYLDGTTLTVYDDAANAYAQGPQPGSIDESMIHFVRDLKIRFPMAPLMMEQFPDVLLKRVTQAEYIEHTSYLGTAAHHILARNAEVDMQIWIADRKDPVPLRILLTYRNAPGQPQFRVDFAKWNMTPKFSKGTFTLARPSGAQKINFTDHLGGLKALVGERATPAEEKAK